MSAEVLLLITVIRPNDYHPSMYNNFATVSLNEKKMAFPEDYQETRDTDDEESPPKRKRITYEDGGAFGKIIEFKWR